MCFRFFQNIFPIHYFCIFWHEGSQAGPTNAQQRAGDRLVNTIMWQNAFYLTAHSTDPPLATQQTTGGPLSSTVCCVGNFVFIRIVQTTTIIFFFQNLVLFVFVLSRFCFWENSKDIGKLVCFPCLCFAFLVFPISSHAFCLETCGTRWDGTGMCTLQSHFHMLAYATLSHGSNAKNMTRTSCAFLSCRTGDSGIPNQSKVGTGTHSNS